MTPREAVRIELEGMILDIDDELKAKNHNEWVEKYLEIQKNILKKALKEEFKKMKYSIL